MIGENSYSNQNTTEDPRKSRRFVIGSISRVNEAISVGALPIPENEGQYVDMILKINSPNTREQDDELRPLIKKIINEENIGRVVRKSDSEDNKDHGASIDYIVEQGGEAPPEAEKDLGVKSFHKKTNPVEEKNPSKEESDYEYFINYGEYRNSK